MKHIKMAGDLHKKSFAQALHWNCGWVNHLLEDKARLHRGENLKCYMTVACFPPLAPFYPKRKQTKKITIKRKYRIIEASRPNPSRPNPFRPFVCNYWMNRDDIWISVKSLVHYLKTGEMTCPRCMYNYPQEDKWMILGSQKLEFGPVF